MDSSRYVEQFNFDREIPLDELLASADKRALEKIFVNLLDGRFKVLDLNEQCLLGDEACEPGHRLPLTLELEPSGYLISDCDNEQCVQAAQTCLVMQLRFAQKYLMASALHIEAIQEDYEKLCQEHEALLESEAKLTREHTALLESEANLAQEHTALLKSEAKYKTLSEHLDEKVNEQVAVIKSAERKLFESEKLASIGHLAAGVAHEINNPIGFIRSNLNTAKNYLDDMRGLGKIIAEGKSIDAINETYQSLDLDFVLEDFQSLLDECIYGSKRVADIVADLKLFSNVDAEEELVADINTYVTNSCNVARTSFEVPIDFKFDLGVLPSFRFRPGYVSQVVFALVSNAVDAMPSGGELFIRSYLIEEKVFVEIKDSGPGIPKEVIDKVFDPFFTTKEVGEGKGLGLTSCRDIVVGHDGDIEIESEAGQGTTVRFWLPVRT